MLHRCYTHTYVRLTDHESERVTRCVGVCVSGVAGGRWRQRLRLSSLVVVVVAFVVADEGDVGEGEVTRATVHFALPLTVHVGARHCHDVPHVQTQSRLVVRIRHYE